MRLLSFAKLGQKISRQRGKGRAFRAVGRRSRNLRGFNPARPLAATKPKSSALSVPRSLSTRSSQRLWGLSVEGFWPQRARRGWDLHSSTRRKSSRPEKKFRFSSTGSKNSRRRLVGLGPSLKAWAPARAGPHLAVRERRLFFMTFRGDKLRGNDYIGMETVNPTMSPPRGSRGPPEFSNRF